ncbi:MAG: UDP-3-O-(3-hydroxymyristoyl)glucosamine N-acyltransferase [Bacteroidetes bacterium]|nr:UDP-3-O-(3-hydroxymyristoyl)glucosamine N-acyltransferase [Bacteroidota bacterium]
MMELQCKEIAAMVGGVCLGDESRLIHSPAKIEDAGAHQISFLANPKYLVHLDQCRAGALIVDQHLELPFIPSQTTIIKVTDAYSSFGLILQAFQSEPVYHAGVHPQSTVDPTAVLGDNVGIGPYSVVSPKAQIGAGCRIASQVYLGSGVRIGENCILHPGVRILDGCQIGDRCVLYANAVIGSDGFGYAPDKDHVYAKIPQTGIVILGNDVEVGANATIDRATMGATTVGDGCKIDNLVHLAHNVELGAHSVIAAQTGISGSTKIGEKCVFGGQVGVAGHIQIAPGSQIGGQTGVTHTIEDANRKWNGTPIMPYMDNQRSNALFRKLPQLESDLLAEIQSLKEAYSSLAREFEKAKAQQA